MDARVLPKPQTVLEPWVFSRCGEDMKKMGKYIQMYHVYTMYSERVYNICVYCLSIASN